LTKIPDSQYVAVDLSERSTFLNQCIEVNMNKVVIKILQDSVVTQTVLGGLTVSPPVAHFL